MIGTVDGQMEAKLVRLKPRMTEGAVVEACPPSGWRLVVPPGPAGSYRLAQVDDNHNLKRSAFPWQPPVRLNLRARASARDIPGTWGFGLWNDPFGMAILSGAERLRLPSLPGAAWFFFAAPPNYLALRDGLAGHGSLAVTFRSSSLPGWLLAFGLPALPLLVLPSAARALRRLARRVVQQDAASLAVDPTEWHAYELEWRAERATFWMDREIVLQTEISPPGPLALVMWVDNQYLALPPDGRFRAGTLAYDQAAWIEIADIEVSDHLPAFSKV